jgi:hypothetical protein
MKFSGNGLQLIFNVSSELAVTVPPQVKLVPLKVKLAEPAAEPALL